MTLMVSRYISQTSLTRVLRPFCLMFVMSLGSFLIVSPALSQELSAALDPDSGRMARPSGDYSNYQTPGSCVSAALRTEILLSYKHLKWPSYDPVNRRLHDSTLSVATQCSVELQQSEGKETLNAIRLAFILGDDQKAELLANGLVGSLGADTAAVTDAISRIVVLAMEVVPMRLEFALRWIAVLDKYSQAVNPPARFASHRSIATHFFKRSSFAQIDEEITYFERWIREVEGPDRIQFMQYADLLYQWGVLSSMFRSFNTPSSGLITGAVTRYKEIMEGIYGTEGRSSYEFKAPFLESLDQLIGGKGKDISPEEAALFKVKKQANPLTRATLYWKVDQNCGIACYGDYALLRRLDSAYGQSGLEIQLVSKTSGYFGGQLFPDSDKEKEKIRDHVHKFLQLPYSLYVYTAKFNTLRDGRRRVELDEFELFYRNAGFVLLDSKGEIKLLGNVNIEGFKFFTVPEHTIDLFIEKTLNSS